MKTITEFSGNTLKTVLKTRQELLATGKTPEELTAALSEALKLEGEKLTLTLNAAEIVEKKSNNLKRVVVWTLQEGEKAPKGMLQKGDHYFVVEYFPGAPERKPGRDRRDSRDRPGRGGKKGGGRKGRDGKRGEKRDFPAKDQSPALAAAGQTDGAATEGVAGEKKRRHRWKPRGPRKEGAPANTQSPGAPTGPVKLIQPKGASSVSTNGEQSS